MRVVRRETRDGVVKLEIEFTDPKPISGGELVFDSNPATLDAISGLQLLGRDSAGVAIRRPSGLQLNFLEANGLPGAASAMPLFSMATSAGSADLVQLRLNAAGTRLLDRNGQPYDSQIGPDRIFTSSVVLLDVRPASGFLLPDSLITLKGVGFQQGAVVEIDGLEPVTARFASEAELQVSYEQPFRIDGKRIRVRNPDGTWDVFYANQQGTVAGKSSRPLLAAAIPFFSRQARASALFAPLTTGTIEGKRYLTGLAFQNLSAQSATVTIETFSPLDVRTARGTVTVPPGVRMWREVTELLPDLQAQAAGYISVRSSVPVQMLGLVGDEDRELLAPIVPLAVRPTEIQGDDDSGPGAGGPSRRGEPEARGRENEIENENENENEAERQRNRGKK